MPRFVLFLAALVLGASFGLSQPAPGSSVVPSSGVSDVAASPFNPLRGAPAPRPSAVAPAAAPADSTATAEAAPAAPAAPALAPPEAEGGLLQGRWKEIVRVIDDIAGFINNLLPILAVVAWLVVWVRYTRRRAMYGVAAACAAPWSLPSQGALIGDLTDFLTSLERKVAKIPSPKAAQREIPAGLRDLVTSGALDPFFTLLEARVGQRDQRVFAKVRELAEAGHDPFAAAPFARGERRDGGLPPRGDVADPDVAARASSWALIQARAEVAQRRQRLLGLADEFGPALIDEWRVCEACWSQVAGDWIAAWSTDVIQGLNERYGRFEGQLQAHLARRAEEDRLAAEQALAAAERARLQAEADAAAAAEEARLRAERAERELREANDALRSGLGDEVADVLKASSD